MDSCQPLRSPRRRVYSILGMDSLITVDLKIEKLAVGGDGLAFPEGRAVFVPGTVPGETVRAALAEDGKADRDWTSAEVVEILDPSPDRIDPECPLYGVCGGCSLQHIAYDRQVRGKAEILRDCLARIGGISVLDIEVVSSEPYSCRNRMQFHLVPSGGIGLKRRAGTEVVETPTCPVADRPIRRWMEAREGRGRAREDLRSYLEGKDRFLVFADGRAGDNGRAGDDGRAGLGEPRVYLEGRDGEVRVPVAGRGIVFHVKSFFQSNLRALDALVPTVVEGLSGGRVADLYCGVGLFGSFLRDSFEDLVCVEHNPFALEYARRNAAGRTEYHALAVEEWVKSPSARKGFETAVLDPPRSGLSPAVRDWLAAARIPSVSYVSCDPATLARDLRDLIGRGYRIESVRMHDFFPQTGHLETHVRLRWD